MIIDAYDVETRLVPTDVCIIGSGPAGLALAFELAGTPLRVVVVESGGGRGSNRQTQALNASAVVRGDYNTIETRRRALGGTATVWGGRWMAFDPLDFQERPWVPNSGWPFDRDDMIPFYDRARAMFGTGFNHESAAEREQELLRPLPLTERGLDARLVERSSPLTLLQKAESVLDESETTTVFLGANALGFNRSSGEDRIVSVPVSTLSGHRFEVQPRRIVLAAGGIENPRLLLESGIHASTEAGPLVGAFFMDHPYLEIGPLEAANRSVPGDFTVDGRLERHGLRPHGMITFAEGRLRDEGLVNCAAHFRVGPPFRHGDDYQSDGMSAAREVARYARRREVPPYIGDLAKTIGRDTASITRTLLRTIRIPTTRGDAVGIRLLVEASPERSSRIVLGSTRDRLDLRRPRVEWRLSDLDRRSAVRFIEVLADMLEEEGLGRVPRRNDDDWPARILPGNHHAGATRMHVDPRFGVVDENAKVHGIQNLFVAGSSVFPTSAAANPTLTIAALAIRLADHIRATT